MIIDFRRHQREFVFLPSVLAACLVIFLLTSPPKKQTKNHLFIFCMAFVKQLGDGSC